MEKQDYVYTYAIYTNEDDDTIPKFCFEATDNDTDKVYSFLKEKLTFFRRKVVDTAGENSKHDEQLQNELVEFKSVKDDDTVDAMLDDIKHKGFIEYWNKMLADAKQLALENFEEFLEYELPHVFEPEEGECIYTFDGNYVIIHVAEYGADDGDYDIKVNLDNGKYTDNLDLYSSSYPRKIAKALDNFEGQFNEFDHPENFDPDLFYEDE